MMTSDWRREFMELETRRVGNEIAELLSKAPPDTSKWSAQRARDFKNQCAFARAHLRNTKASSQKLLDALFKLREFYE